jgi:disulfide bond formation protein DsbB
MTLSSERLRATLAWIVIVMTAVPVGGAVVLGVAHGDSPCILCWAQRASMALIALTGLFVWRYGPRPKYLGLTVLLGAWGVYMALRHSALHLARDVGQGFAPPILGVHTYVWAGFVHFVVLAAAGVLLLLMRGPLADWGAEPLAASGRQDRVEHPHGGAAPSESLRPGSPGGAAGSHQTAFRATGTGRFAFALFVVVIAANALQAFVTTGPPPFIGQADPLRFSLNPKRWVWMMEELEGRISLRGAWTIPPPDPDAADPDPAHGPLAPTGATAVSLPPLPVLGWDTITAPLDGQLTDLAYDPATGRFLAVTDRYGVYVLDSSLSRIEHRVRLDPGFAIDLTPLAGAAFLSGDTLAVLSTNKSFVLLRPDSPADPDREWRNFLETDGRVTELRRSRFATVRARQMYVLSLAYDPSRNELITVSVPSPRHRRLVVSRFARRDLLLASEFEPRLAAGLTPAAEGRTAGEYVVTGAAVADGLLYAVSAAYSTLLVMDLEAQTLAAAYVVPGVEQPVGVAVRGGELLVAQADARVIVLERPER